MKITCQSCQAKYTIADEKVVGKVVKIRCKKCGATIVVNGSDSGASAEAGRGGETPAAEGWTVNVNDGDQRTMTDEEIVTAYRARVIDDETFCWKDGMGDWAPLREIATLYDACTAGVSGASGAARAAVAASASGTAAAALAADTNGSGAGAAPVAARRAGGRAGAADLFGGAAQAGGEDDVMTSAPAKVPQPHEGDGKLTGARNENSVLFSLATLTGKSDRPPPPPPDSEASGLIDIRQLSAQLNAGDDGKKKGSRVDDIMNLSGGGAFLPNLTAPALAPPSPIDMASPGVGAKPSLSPGRSRGMIFLAAGGGLLVILAAIGGALTLMRGKGDETADKPSASASASAAAAGPETSASAAPTASASAAAAAPSEAPSAPPAPPTATAAPATPPPAKVAQAAPAREAPRPAAAAESDQPFNMGEAKARLAAVAGAVQSCKKPSGPTGTGRVVVVFAPSGAAQSASVTGEPFEGTATGGCVAAHFRSVRVPAFAGSPFSVSKSFSIN
jgi:predicted Zn finger-like uncharacterized protein